MGAGLRPATKNHWRSTGAAGSTAGWGSGGASAPTPPPIGNLTSEGRGDGGVKLVVDVHVR